MAITDSKAFEGYKVTNKTGNFGISFTPPAALVSLVEDAESFVTTKKNYYTTLDSQIKALAELSKDKKVTSEDFNEAFQDGLNKLKDNYLEPIKNHVKDAWDTPTTLTFNQIGTLVYQVKQNLAENENKGFSKYTVESILEDISAFLSYLTNLNINLGEIQSTIDDIDISNFSKSIQDSQALSILSDLYRDSEFGELVNSLPEIQIVLEVVQGFMYTLNTIKEVLTYIEPSLELTEIFSLSSLAIIAPTVLGQLTENINAFFQKTLNNITKWLFDTAIDFLLNGIHIILPSVIVEAYSLVADRLQKLSLPKAGTGKTERETKTLQEFLGTKAESLLLEDPDYGKMKDSDLKSLEENLNIPNKILSCLNNFLYIENIDNIKERMKVNQKEEEISNDTIAITSKDEKAANDTIATTSKDVSPISTLVFLFEEDEIIARSKVY